MVEMPASRQPAELHVEVFTCCTAAMLALRVIVDEPHVRNRPVSIGTNRGGRLERRSEECGFRSSVVKNTPGHCRIQGCSG